MPLILTAYCTGPWQQ